MTLESAIVGIALDCPGFGRAAVLSAVRASVFVAAACLAMPGAAGAQSPPAPDDLAPVRRVVDDYVGLYRKDTLAEWRALFLPSFTATSPSAAGGVTVRTLDEFYGAQARGFARAREMSETLEQVTISRSGRLATAWADFVFHQDGTSRRGRLVLGLVETAGGWKIASLLFSY